MSRMKLISCFRDTVQLSYAMPVYTSTVEAQKSNRVYPENFISDKVALSQMGEIILKKETPFALAKNNRHIGKIAVLNCANPIAPGGGIEDGIMGQEECFCRSSNLAICLNAMNVAEEFYEFHKKHCDYFYSDRLIYTNNITIFKSDEEIPVLMDQSDWFQVDVISCAAPYISNARDVDSKILRLKLKSRIKNIFEAALDNNAEVIILGTFGCDSSGNSPVVVAELFRSVIKEQQYEKYFKKIVFALHSYTQENCFEIWKTVFDDCTVCDKEVDEFQREKHLVSQNMKGTSPYYKKKFSILGDSISTLEGFNPEKYHVHYTGETCIFNDIHKMKDTWWGMVIDTLGGELLINNSYSGSRVTKVPNQDNLFPSGCSDERTKGLHIGKEKPDVIIVFLGINDWARGVKSENSGTSLIGDENYEVFRFAYETMLYKLKMNYPKSEIWCCTLCTTAIKSQPNFVFPDTYGGVAIEVYNEIIRDIVPIYDCKLIDLYQYRKTYDTLDGSHPTFEGMQILAEMIIESMVGTDELEVAKEINVYNAANDGLNQDIHQETTLLTILPVNNENSFWKADKSNKYSDIIHLKIVNTGEEVHIQKDVFVVGRYKDCELRFNSEQKHLMIGRRQATFFYDNEEWYLMDHSSNGTWLNDERMEPDKKYLLKRNDVIDFARTEKVIFL